MAIVVHLQPRRGRSVATKCSAVAGLGDLVAVGKRGGRASGHAGAVQVVLAVLHVAAGGVAGRGRRSPSRSVVALTVACGGLDAAFDCPRLEVPFRGFLAITVVGVCGGSVVFVVGVGAAFGLALSFGERLVSVS